MNQFNLQDYLIIQQEMCNVESRELRTRLNVPLGDKDEACAQQLLRKIAAREWVRSRTLAEQGLHLLTHTILRLHWARALVGRR